MVRKQVNEMNDNDRGDSGNLIHTTEIVPSSVSARVVTQPVVVRDIPSDDTSNESSVDVSRILHSVRRNWLLGMTLGLIAAAPMACLAWKFFQLNYTAIELVRISPTQASLINFGARESVSAGEFKSFKNTQKQLIIQPFALNNALKEDEVAKLPMIANHPDPIKWLQKALKIEFPDESEIMSVSLTCSDPSAAYKIVKAVVGTYKSDVVDKENVERQAKVETLERILQETEEKVRKKRNDLKRLVESLGMSDKSTVDLSQQQTLQQFSEVRSQLGKTKFDIMSLENELRFHRILKGGAGDSQISTVKSEVQVSEKKPGTEGDAPLVTTAQHTIAERDGSPVDSDSQTTSQSTVKDPRLEEMLETDLVAVRLTKEVERLQNLIKNAPKRYDSKKAEEFVAQYQSKLDEVHQKLDERTKKLEQRLPGAAPQGQGMSEAEIITAKIGIFKEQEKMLREEMVELMAESKKFGKQSIDVEMLRKEIDALEPMVSKINQQIEQMKIELRSTSRITLLPSNGVPTAGENKKRLPVAALAGLAGLFGPLLLLVLRDFLRNHVNNMAGITNGVNISVLGSIPHVPRKVLKYLNDPKHVVATQWRGRVAESVTGVTAMLLRKLASEGHRIIMVASATSGEGKSTLAELLARSLADSGHKTLLIDFDFRKPELHRRFNVPLEPGASEVLRSGADLKQTARQTQSPNLSVLTAGNCPGSLLLEAANGTLDNLFKECRADYELVVVDSSPLLPVVDGRLVGQFTDGAIMSVIKDKSQISQVLAARTIMSDFGITVLGCVVSGENTSGYYNAYGSSKEIPGAVARGISASRSMSAM